MLGRYVKLWLLLGALTGCYAGSARTFHPQTFDSESGWIAVRDVPTIRQHGEKECGATATAMLLRHWQENITPADIRQQSQVPSERGIPAGFLRQYLRGKGLQAYLFKGRISDLEQELRSGRPVIVGVYKPYSDNQKLAHYQVVVAVHPAKKSLVVIDPADGWRQYSYTGFQKEWRAAKFLTLVALR